MEQLSVLTKWEDLAEYTYVALKGYPKSERHTLAARTIDALGSPWPQEPAPPRRRMADHHRTLERAAYRPKGARP